MEVLFHWSVEFASSSRRRSQSKLIDYKATLLIIAAMGNATYVSFIELVLV